MLASPLLLGALAAGLHWVHLLLGLFWFAGYFAFHATSLWLKAGRRARYLRPVQVYGGGAAVLGLLVLSVRPGLVWLAPMFALPLGVGLYAAAHRRERDLLAGLTTVVASALMTVVAYVAGGPGSPSGWLVGPSAVWAELHRWATPDERYPWLLALGQFLYFGGTVCYVKSVIRQRGVPRYLRVSVGWHAVALAIVAGWAAAGWAHGPAAVGLVAVFGVLLVRAWLVPRHHLTPKQIGIAEIVVTVAVALTSLWALRPDLPLPPLGS